MFCSAMKIETALAVSPGDVLRIDVADSTLLAEAVYFQGTPGRLFLGVKFFHRLKHEPL